MKRKFTESSPAINSYITQKSKKFTIISSWININNFLKIWISMINSIFVNHAHVSKATELIIFVQKKYKIQWMRKLKMKRRIFHMIKSSSCQCRNMWGIKNSNPPYICTLIEMTESIARYSTDLWCDIKVPIAIEEREKLVKIILSTSKWSQYWSWWVFGFKAHFL